jgi:hypothetical protein
MPQPTRSVLAAGSGVVLWRTPVEELQTRQSDAAAAPVGAPRPLPVRRARSSTWAAPPREGFTFGDATAKANSPPGPRFRWLPCRPALRSAEGPVVAGSR